MSNRFQQVERTFGEAKKLQIFFNTPHFSIEANKIQNKPNKDYKYNCNDNIYTTTAAHGGIETICLCQTICGKTEQ